MFKRKKLDALASENWLSSVAVDPAWMNYVHYMRGQHWKLSELSKDALGSDKIPFMLNEFVHVYVMLGYWVLDAGHYRLAENFYLAARLKMISIDGQEVQLWNITYSCEKKLERAVLHYCWKLLSTCLKGGPDDQCSWSVVHIGTFCDRSSSSDRWTALCEPQKVGLARIVFQNQHE